MEAKFEKQIYNPGEKAKIKVVVDASKCLLDVKKIHAEYMRSITLDCRCHERRIWLKRKPIWAISKVSVDGVKSGSQRQTFEVSLEIKISKRMCCSSQGALIQVEDFFRVTCEMNKPCFSFQNPKIEYPIRICHTSREGVEKKKSADLEKIHLHPEKDFVQTSEKKTESTSKKRKGKGGTKYAEVPSLMAEDNPFEDNRMEVETVRTEAYLDQEDRLEGSSMIVTNSVLSPALNGYLGGGHDLDTKEEDKANEGLVEP